MIPVELHQYFRCLVYFGLNLLVLVRRSNPCFAKVAEDRWPKGKIFGRTKSTGGIYCSRPVHDLSRAWIRRLGIFKIRKDARVFDPKHDIRQLDVCSTRDSLGDSQSQHSCPIVPQCAILAFACRKSSVSSKYLIADFARTSGRGLATPPNRWNEYSEVCSGSWTRQRWERPSERPSLNESRVFLKRQRPAPICCVIFARQSYALCSRLICRIGVLT